MKLFRRSTEDAPSADAIDSAEQTGASTEEQGQARTPGKGRATPRRREAEGKRRGPVPPPPQTQREAVKRMKQNKPERRKAASERRERMMAGDERYLLPRDRGPARAHARDIVDSRRNLMGLFMPLVLVVFATTLVRNPIVQEFATLACLALLLTMIFEGTMLGRMVNKRVRAKYPDSQEKSLSLGWYSFTRAMQIRKLRVPRPRVTPKDAAKIG